MPYPLLILTSIVWLCSIADCLAQEASDLTWSIPVTVSIGEVEKKVSFGVKSGASDSFDVSIDTLSPPPPPTVFHTFFLVSGIPGITDRLSHDYRPVNRESNEWTLVISGTKGNQGVISWTVSDLPEIVFPPGRLSIDGVDMLVETSLSFVGDQMIKITFSVSSLIGDFDNDGSIDFNDFFLYVDHFGEDENSPDWNDRFDLSGNNKIDFDDFFLFVDHFGERQ